MNIADILRDRAEASGQAAAIVEPHRTVTFAELDRMAAHVAAQLERAGIEPGDRALVFCPMSVALYSVLIGLWRIGAVAMFLDPSATRDHLERCCRRVPPRAFIGVPRAHLLRFVTPALRKVDVALSTSHWVPGASRLRIDSTEGGRSAIAPVDPAAPALVTFTSGSTGEPKAAVRSHGFLLAQHRVLADELHLAAGQRDLATLPIFVLANLASGVTSIIPNADLRHPGSIDPAPVARQIQSTRPTRLAASSAFVSRLVNHAPPPHSLLKDFEAIYTGGAPVFPKLLRQVSAAAPSAALVAAYGSTEAEPIAKIRWTDITAGDLRAMEAGAGLLAGKPVAAIEVRILPDRVGLAVGPYTPEAFDLETAGSEVIGEIVVCGEHVLTGYFEGIGDSETKVRVGGRVWHRTGDAGYFDAAGRLWLMGRCAAKIEDANGTLYPFAVECAAQETSGIARCALVSHGGQRVLVVEPDGSTQPDALRMAVQARLGWAHLADVIVVRALPVDRRHNAKIDYPALERLLGRLSR